MYEKTRSPWPTGFGMMEVEALRRREVLMADARRSDPEGAEATRGGRLSFGRVARLFGTRATAKPETPPAESRRPGRSTTGMPARGCMPEG